MAKTAKEEYTFIAEMISESMKDLSRQMSTQENPVRFTFTEEFDRETELLSITLLSSTPGNAAVAIQELRYRISKEQSKHVQFVYAYKGFLNYLMTTALLTLHNVGMQMREDEELQEASIDTKS